MNKHEDLLRRLATAPERLAVAAIAREAADAAAGGPEEGEWSAREVIAHLVAVETHVWQARLDSLEAGGIPRWTWTEPSPVDNPRAITLEGALSLFADFRAATVIQAAGFDDAQWARTGDHDTYGLLDVGGLLTVAADHDDEHLAGLLPA